MTIGNFIGRGDKTSCGGTVLEGEDDFSFYGIATTLEGHLVSCGVTGDSYQIMGGISHMTCNGRRIAGTLDSFSGCPCEARLIPSNVNDSYENELSTQQDSRGTTQPSGHAKPNVQGTPRQSSFTSLRTPPASSVSELPRQSCENLWREYQQRAEAIVAPAGRLIADPKERNRVINAAYARLWLEDRRFQWAGLAAFASKQVGCGLLHAADSIERIQVEHDAGQRLENRARKGLFGLFSSTSESDRQAKIREFEQSQRDYEEARSNNPLPSIDYRRDGEPLSLVQQQLNHVYEILAMGNTTLFLDVFALHVFYKERGLKALKSCLRSRSNIYGVDQQPMLWPVEQRKLNFGTEFEEIVEAFEAIEAGNIANSVERLAWHEQKNILQPAMYSDMQLVALLRANHILYVTGFPSGATQAIELTLTSRCQRVDDGRTIGFGSNPFADLSDLSQRMPFVLDAAARFDELLSNGNRHKIEQAIEAMVAGRGVR